MRKDSPCLGCMDRQVGCHSVCELYAEYQKGRITEIRNRNRELSSYYLSVERSKRNREKARKRGGRKT